MQVTVNDIKWASYRDFEGPYFPGRFPYVLPPIPDFLDKVLAVVAATEGKYDSVNCYDRCILSVGMIQWCERLFLVSELLGRCYELDPRTWADLITFPPSVDFRKGMQGKWRFYLRGVEITTEAQQREFFLGSATAGFKGSWTPETRAYAKRTAACFANFWNHPPFRIVQAAWTKSRLPGFVTAEAAKWLPAGDGWRDAMRAMYYSFAANNPSIASKSLLKAVNNPGYIGSDDADRFRIAAQTLTFGPGVDIYPARYAAIAPVLKQLFNVPIPQTADALRSWVDAPPAVVRVEVTEEESAAAGRLIALSDGVMSGTAPQGLDAVDAIKES